MRFLNASFALLVIFFAATAFAQAQNPSQPKQPPTQAKPEGTRPQVMVPDSGIYLKHVDGANMCASIMSYNFSPGDNPQLESVTTCTPTNTQATKRARVPRPAPSGPQLRQTVLESK